MDLRLSLKTKWFEMTDSENGKSEDYREITPYWVKRLMRYQNGDFSDLTLADLEEICKDLNECTGADDFQEGSDIDYTIDNWYLSFKKFTTNTMTLGYPSKAQSEKFKIYEHAGIEIRKGVEEWGAEPDKLYFVIKHGKQIQQP